MACNFTFMSLTRSTFKSLKSVLLLLVMLYSMGTMAQRQPNFNLKTDLLIANYDCKTDVDDLHSIAAFATVLAQPKYKKLNYHAVAGTYGIQEGLYVPPNDLFALSFGKNWSDAHADREQAARVVTTKAVKVLNKKGHIWIAEAGQSDFSTILIRTIRTQITDVEILSRIHIVQHSDWNEEVTSPEAIQYVKTTIDYHKIPDGNAVGNGTAGFRSEAPVDWQSKINNENLVSLWNLAIETGNQYNGKQGRYNNEAIAQGGLDFSDTSEIMYILGYSDIKDADDFFETFQN